ncbi:MAG: hypothetical protein ACK55Z_13450, partial [bacterium]
MDVSSTQSIRRKAWQPNVYVITKPNTNVIVNLAKTAPAVIKASVRKHGAYTTRWASIEAVKILITSSPCARVAR